MLILVLLGIGSVFLINYVTDVHAYNTCSRDCLAPTLGLSSNGDRVVENGFSINGKSFNVAEYSQTIPTQNYKVGETVNIRLLVYENSGTDSLAHVSLIIGDFPDRFHETQKVMMLWDQKFDGTQTVGTIDFEKLVKDVKIKATKVDPFVTALDISFSFSKKLETSSIKVDTWDQIRSYRVNYFMNAIEVKG